MSRNGFMWCFLVLLFLHFLSKKNCSRRQRSHSCNFYYIYEKFSTKCAQVSNYFTSSGVDLFPDLGSKVHHNIVAKRGAGWHGRHHTDQEVGRKNRLTFIF